jgi:hypothetical protein
LGSDTNGVNQKLEFESDMFSIGPVAGGIYENFEVMARLWWFMHFSQP